jgi:hypothetical protein
MNIIKVIASIFAVIFILIGVFYIWGSSSVNAQPGWVSQGLISIVVGFVLLIVAFAIWYIQRVTPSPQPDNVTLKIDLPANVNLDTLKCKSCGGVLKPENIKMVAGAPVVECPYCNTTYQLTEEPKW